MFGGMGRFIEGYSFGKYQRDQSLRSITSFCTGADEQGHTTGVTLLIHSVNRLRIQWCDSSPPPSLILKLPTLLLTYCLCTLSW